MNTLFIDTDEFQIVRKKDNKNIETGISEKDSQLAKILKYEIRQDILSHGIYSNNILLKIDIRLLQKFANCDMKKRKNFSMTKKIFEIVLLNKIRHFETLHLVFSKKLDQIEYKECKRYLFSVLNRIQNIDLKEIVISNQMNIHDIVYINDYMSHEKIDPNKMRVLIALDSIEDYSDKKMIEYISNFKYVDILKMSGFDKIRYKKLNEQISKINEEYGSTIEITQKRNIQEYNVYLMYSKINKDDFRSHYILRKKSKVFQMYDEEEDVLNQNMKSYEKNKYEIETLFNRIGIDIKHYSKNKLGAFMIEDGNVILDI